MVLFGKTYTIKRKAQEGYYDASGNYVKGSAIPDFTVIADCQALTAKEIESLNIGRSDLGKIKIFCDTELLTAVQGDDGNYLQNGDRIVYLTEEYEIIQRLAFGNLLVHYEYIAELREDE